jgi:hypothetical protein
MAPLARADDYTIDNTAPPAPQATDNTTINNNQAPGTAADTQTTTAQASEVTRGVFASPFTVTPAVGALGYQALNGDYTSRITTGILMDFDIGAATFTGPSHAKLGLQTGLLFSHLGSPGSNFFGANAAVPVQDNANAFTVPIEATAGWAVSDTFETSLLFGANMLYRSTPSSMIVGRNDLSTGSRVDFFPSLGLQGGWALGSAAALTVRGDYIPTPKDDMFTATIGATFPLA